MKWILPIFLISVSSWACEIHLPERILMSPLSSGASDKEAHNCEHSQIEELYNVLRDQSGPVPLARLQAALGKGIRLKAQGSKIQIENIQSILEEKYPSLRESQSEIQTQVLGSYLALKLSDQIEVNCHPCQFRGAEHFNIKVLSLGQLKLSLDIPTQVFKLEEAIRLKTTLNAFSDKIQNSQWEVTRAPAINYGRYFTQLEKLKYFKTNKQIKAGEYLKESDLTPLNIVRAGDKVEITFENDHLKVKAQAISRQNGGIEDVIEVWNQSNGKKYKGVVTDFNHVTIKL